MKKTLVALFTLVALAIGIQMTFAACPCTNPCPSPCAAAPCNPCATPAPCQTYDSCDNNCCDNGNCRPKCKCTWWKIFEDKTCCYKCNNECNSCLSAKRAHWYKFWTDRCVVKNNKCDCKCPCN
ncbi:MAG: hypothetical protein WCY19_05315 [Candidatus Gastranaerophilaceae bacterium]